MPDNKKDILAQLQKKILPLQGYRLPANGNGAHIELGPIEAAFPNSCFPFGAIHEFLYEKVEHAAASSGFIAGLLASIMRSGGITAWISSSRTIFPPALKAFDIEPDHIIFIDLQNSKDILGIMEETLKCDGLTAVVGEIRDISFIASRRLQLAVEQTGVTGFILRKYSNNCNTIACISRWKIKPLPTALDNDMPGVGFPRWNVELMKIRNGKPGTWQMEWASGRFQHVSSLDTSISPEQKRKTG